MNLIERKYEALRLKFRKYYIKATYKKRRKKINCEDFTVISNNCWGGFVYQSYGLKYLTPTIGCFFMADDYIKFISNIKKYINNSELHFIEPKKSKWYQDIKNISKFGEYPIGVIDDIEIQFLHYASPKIAKEKWEERKQRINYDKIIYKFSEMNLCNEKNIMDFQKLDLPNKICFISNKNAKLRNDFTFVVTKQERSVRASEEPVGKSRITNINNLINNLNRGDNL